MLIELLLFAPAAVGVVVAFLPQVDMADVDESFGFAGGVVLATADDGSVDGTSLDEVAFALLVVDVVLSAFTFSVSDFIFTKFRLLKFLMLRARKEVFR